MLADLALWAYLVLGALCSAFWSDGEDTNLASIGKSLFNYCAPEPLPVLYYREAGSEPNGHSRFGFHWGIRPHLPIDLGFSNPSHNLLPWAQPFIFELPFSTGKWVNVMSMSEDFLGSLAADLYYPGFEDLTAGAPTHRDSESRDFNETVREDATRVGRFSGQVFAAVASKLPCTPKPGTARLAPAQIVAAAIEAQGGKDRLARLRCYRSICRGTRFLDDDPVELEMTRWVKRPDREKQVYLGQIDDKQIEEVSVFTGDHLWRRTPDRTAESWECAAEELATRQNEVYMWHVLLLYPLLEEPGFKLTSLPAKWVGGRAALAVQVSHDDKPDLTLFFDRKTKLLLGYRSSPLNASSSKPASEIYLGAYKEFDGLKYPTKMRIVVSGEQYFKGEVVELEFLDDIDDSLFARP